MNVSSLSAGAFSGVRGSGRPPIPKALQEISIPGQSGGSEIKLSDPASVLNRLQDLQSSDPEAFKSTVKEISSKLAEAAGKSTNSFEGQFLTKLSEQFGQAAETGDLSSLEPPSPPANLSSAQKAYLSNSPGESDLLAQLFSGQQSGDSQLSTLLQSLFGSAKQTNGN